MPTKTPRIKLLDTVALLEDLPDRQLKRAEVGTVVEILAPQVYEVEFCDADGQTMPSWRCAVTSWFRYTTGEKR